jgi:hypothetical protein
MNLRDYVERRKNGVSKPTRPKQSQTNRGGATKGKRTQRRERRESKPRHENIEPTRSERQTVAEPSEILIACQCGKPVKYAGTLICEDCFVEKVIACDPKKIHNLNTFILRGE